MEATVRRIDELEVASFIDRLALFSASGCNPQQALSYCLASVPHDSPLREEIETVMEQARPGQSPAALLLQVSKRLDSEPLLLTSMAFVSHVELGVDYGPPLAKLAEMIRFQHRQHTGEGADYEREFAVAMFIEKLDFLLEIDKKPQDAVSILAQHNSTLGPELARICEELASGYGLAEAFGRSADRIGSRGMRLLAVGLGMRSARQVPLAAILHQSADVIVRELDAESRRSSSTW